MRVLQCVMLMALVSKVVSFGTLCGSAAHTPKNLPPDAYEQVPDTKVVFYGDQGRVQQGRGAEYPLGVLRQVKAFAPEFIIHSGDFDYADSPWQMEETIGEVFDLDFPIFANIGNHDIQSWETDTSRPGSPGYLDRWLTRLAAFGGAEYCYGGEYGVNRACMYKGLHFVLSGVGTRGNNHADFIDATFSEATASEWRVCTWHKNQRLMQIGNKRDETGWDVYETCREHGAIIATGHEHSYCRSRSMTQMNPPVMADENEPNGTVTIKPGQTFVFVSGIAGRSLRTWDDELRMNPFWAAANATDSGIVDGALMCTFNVGGNMSLATCTQVDMNGDTTDEFDIYKEMTHGRTTASRKFKGKFQEFPVREPEDDMTVGMGQRHCGADVLTVSEDSTVVLRFSNVTIARGDVIKQAFLQVYGAEEAVGETRIDIAVETGKSSALGCTSNNAASVKTTGKIVRWHDVEGDVDGWERHEVWVSPDISDLIKEVVSSNHWRPGSDITVALSAQGAARRFYGREASKCTTPHLTIERE